jgi:hypothetical protein
VPDQVRERGGRRGSIRILAGTVAVLGVVWLALLATPLAAHANPLGMHCPKQIGGVTLSQEEEPAGQYYDVYNLTCHYTYPVPAGQYPSSHYIEFVWVNKYNPHITQNYGCEPSSYGDFESQTKKTEVRMIGERFLSSGYPDTVKAAAQVAASYLATMEPASLPCGFTPPPSSAPAGNPAPTLSVVPVNSMGPAPGTDNGGGVPVAAILGGGAVVVGGGAVLVNKLRKPGDDPGTPATGTGPATDSPFLTTTPGLVTLQGQPAIDALVKRGATLVPGTTYVDASGDLPNGIPGSGWQTTQIPDPKDPTKKITVVDPNAVVVLVDTHVPVPVPPAGPTVPAVPPVPAVPAVPAGPAAPPPPVTTPPVTTPPPVPPQVVIPPVPPPVDKPIVPPVVTPPPPPPVVTPPPPPPPPAQPPPPPPKPPVNIPDHPLLTQLLQPGGSTVTIPPGDVGPLMPKELLDGKGNIQIPSDAKVSSLVKGLIDGEPPPKLSIDPKSGNLVVTPAGKLTSWGASLTQTSAKVHLSAFDGQVHGTGYIDTMGMQKDISGDIQKAVKVFNNRVDQAGLKVTSLTIDPKTGISVTTAPK